jgi:hypothetical protein
MTSNWLRVSSRLGAVRLGKPMGWEGITAARRAMRRCVFVVRKYRHGAGERDHGAMAGDETKISKRVVSFGSSADD